MGTGGLARRLYRGDTRFDFVGKRRRWYAISAVLLAICVASIVARGFNYGIEFAGGNQYQIPATQNVTLAEFQSAVESTGVPVESAQRAGTGSTATYVIKTESLSPAKNAEVKQAVESQLHINAVDDSHISSSWGSDVSAKALRGLIIFLVAVCVYLAFRFEWKMAVAAIAALLHDLLLTAGIYSLVGFEVTPSTIVGLLTILGYSLYDTVVVFDKVSENTKGILGGSRTTYTEAANVAVNQTLMRSINTSLISLLPVAGLLFVGAGLLGVGTLKDLALVLFVGLATGAYSSIFLATPLLVSMKEREQPYIALQRRVAAKRQSAATEVRAERQRGGARGEAAEQRRAATAVLDRDEPTADAAADGRRDDAPSDAPDEETTEIPRGPAETVSAGAGLKPRPGARPAGQSRKKKSSRPTGKRKHR